MDSLTERIRNTDLRGDQNTFAQQVLENLHKMAFLSGPELARECGVSVSTTTRFAQKLGYKGFPQLKLAMEEQYRKTTTPLEMFQSFVKKGESSGVEKISIERDLKNIESMATNLEDTEFQKVVQLLSSRPKVFLSAIAISEILVEYLGGYMEALSKPVVKLKSFGITRQAEVMDWGADDVLIGFSFQRIFKEMCELFEYAKNKGIKTVAITDSSINPLAQVADHVLVTPVIGTTFGLSLTAPITMINMLVNSVVATDMDQSLEAMKTVKSGWEKYPIFANSDNKKAKKEK